MDELTRDVAALNDRQDIVELNEEIRKLRKIIEEYDDRLATLVSSQEEALKMKDEEIERMRNSNSIEGTSSKIIRYSRKRSTDEDFKMIKSGRKKKGSSTNVTVNKCEFINCGNENIDLIRCNNCDMLVCEICNDINVSTWLYMKMDLRKIMNRNN